MNDHIEIAIKVVSPIIALATLLLNQLRHQKAKVISYYGHISTFRLSDEARTVVHAHSIILYNAGNKAATNVRLSHNVYPSNINIYPQIKYQVEELESGNTDILIPTLVPKEQVTISYLYFPPITFDQINTMPKSDEGFAKVIDVIPSPVLNPFLKNFIILLMLIGASMCIYVFLKLITVALG